MRVCPVLFLLLGLAVTASAQPTPSEPLPPVEEVAARLVADGLLSDSLVAQVRAHENGRLLHSHLLYLAGIHVATARGPQWVAPVAPDSLPEALFPSSDAAADVARRLRAAGAISERTRETILDHFEEWDAVVQLTQHLVREAKARGEQPMMINPFVFGLIGPDQQVFQLAIDFTEREERLSPERWRPRLDALAQTGHLGASDRDRVLDALATGEASTLEGALRRLPRVLVVHPEALPVSFDEAARFVADTLTAWLGRSGVADLRVGAVSATVERRPVWGYGSTFWTLVLTAEADGRRYAAETFGSATTYDGQTTGEPSATSVTWAVISLVNKVLRDRGQPHRLATARLEPGDLDPEDRAALTPDDPEPERPLAVAAVTADEAAIYGRQGSDGHSGLLSLGFPGGSEQGRAGGAPEARFTTDRIAADVDLLARLRLVSDSARALGEARLARMYVAAPGQVFGAVGLTWSTHSLQADTESESPFGELLLHLAGLSRGAFVPTATEETFDAGRVAVAFSLGDRRFSADLETWETSFDDAFLPFVNRALGEAGVDGRFLDLEPEDDESATYLFLTSDQRRVLAEAGLVEADE